MRLPLIGLALGVAGSLAVTRTMEHLLFETATADATTYVGVVALLAASALIACYVPARRAAAIDPISALRQE